MSPGLTKCSLEARSPPLGTTDLENSVMWEKGLRSVWKHRWVRPYLLKMFAVVTLPIPCSLPEPCRFFLKWWKLPGEAFRPFSWGHSSHAPWHLCHALEATKGGMASAWLYLGYLFMKPAPHSGGGGRLGHMGRPARRGTKAVALTPSWASTSGHTSLLVTWESRPGCRTSGLQWTNPANGVWARDGPSLPSLPWL